MFSWKRERQPRPPAQPGAATPKPCVSHCPCPGSSFLDRCFPLVLNPDIPHRQPALHSPAFDMVVPPFHSSKCFSKSISKSEVLFYLSGKQFALRIFSLASLTTSSTYCNVLKYKLNKIIFSSTGNQCISFLITILFLSFEHLADKTMSQGQFYILQLTILITDIL